MPSSKTSVRKPSSPRILMALDPPGPPALLTATPGWVRNMSNRELKPISKISSWVITDIEVPTSRKGMGTREEVITISSSLSFGGELCAVAKKEVQAAAAAIENENLFKINARVS